MGRKEGSLPFGGGDHSNRQCDPKGVGGETLLVGLSLPDCRAHGPDETFPLGYLERGAKMNRALLREIAEV